MSTGMFRHLPRIRAATMILFLGALGLCLDVGRGAAQVPGLPVQGLVAGTPEPADTNSAPPGTWSTPFAFPAAEVLTIPLDQVMEALSAQAKVTLSRFQVVAVTAGRVVYVTGEAPSTSVFYPSAMASYVWSSTDGGATWKLLVTAKPDEACGYDVRLLAAALHPDGQRVFLGFTEGIYLDGTAVRCPSALKGATALHVSSDGAYLYAASQDLMASCDYLEVPGGTKRISSAGLYRARLGATLEWERLPGTDLGGIQPVTRLGSDPADDAVIYYGNERSVFRVRLVTPQSQGWQLVATDAVPRYVTREGRLETPTSTVRVPSSYVGGWTPHDNIDLRYSWAGFLFAHEGVVYGRWTAYFSQVTFTAIKGSRDAGLSWSDRVSVSEPPLADARGSLGFMAQTITGQPGPGVSVGPWNVDPVDPLTLYTTLVGLDLIYRSSDHGATWVPLGQGLPSTPAIAGIGIDSLGSLYVWARSDSVWVRQVAHRVARISQVTATPYVGVGDTVRLTARIDPWPDPSASLPSGLQVTAVPGVGPFPEPDEVIELRDDGLPPDSLADDRVWSGRVRMEEGRRLGNYGLIVAAVLPDSPAARASRRSNYQVVPRGVRSVFTDTLQAGWSCEPSAATLLSTQHVCYGRASLKVTDQITCTWSGEPLEPFGRQLRFWAYSEAGIPALGINDLKARGIAPVVPAGQWVNLTVPLEALTAYPAVDADYRNPQVPNLTILHLSASAPVWLDNVTVWSPLPDRPAGPTAVTEVSSDVRPLAPVLLPAYPNPFNPSTMISYELAGAGDVSLAIYDLAGQRVRLLAQGGQGAGRHQVVWDGRSETGKAVASGVYLCVLRAGVWQQARKLALVR